MQFTRLIYILSVITLFSCSTNKNQSGELQIVDNVKNYLFLPDSTQINLVITDTLFKENLEELFTSLDNNIFLIEADLDSLSNLIDDASYKKLNLEREETKKQDLLHNLEKRILQFKLMQAQLNTKRQGFKQTNRILMHLQRSITKNIAGFNIVVDYELDKSPIQLEFLLDANYSVVD